MKTRYLFPHKYKLLGWILLLIGVGFGLAQIIFEFESPDFLSVKVYPIIGFNDVNFDGSIVSKPHINNIYDELLSLFIIIGSILVAFSKTKVEDEFIAKIRVESLIWAVYVNYGLLILMIIFIYEGAFLDVMIYNMFTVLIFFVIRFHFVLYKTKRQLSYEE